MKLMQNNQSFLIFDIDIEELNSIKEQLAATEHQLKAAYNRAVSRTQTTMQKRSRKLLAEELDAKSAKRLQRRMQSFKLKRSQKNKLSDLKLWFGLNDIGPHNLKGRISSVVGDGGSFTSSKLGSFHFDKGFTFKRSGQKYLYERYGPGENKIRSVKIPISDHVQVRIEDEIFADLPDVFMHHFETDLKGRVKTGLNKTGWR